MATPNRSAAQLTTVMSTLVRRAAASAPRSAPTLTTDMRSVKVTSLPPMSRVAKSGMTVWKL